jgi:hypothetical protein
LALVAYKHATDRPSTHPRTARVCTHGCLVVAQYDYDTSIAGELPLKTGERVLVLSKQTGDAQWWSGRAANGRVGQFPCAYVEEVPAAAPAPAPAPVAAPATKSAVAAGGVGAAAAAAGLARAGTTARAAPPAKAPAKPGTRALVPPPIAYMHTHSHSLTLTHTFATTRRI